MSHQKAAYLLITELYTPQTMMKNDSLRKTLQWYIRYDTFVGILSGTGTQLGREWFEIQSSFYIQQAKEFPHDLTPKYEERFAWIRLTGYDVGQLVRSKARGAITEQDFFSQIDLFHQKVLSFRATLDPALTDPSKLVRDISGGRKPDQDGIVDPYEPDLLYGGDLFDTNILFMDFYGFELIFNSQLHAVQGRSDPIWSRNCALKMCQLFEAIQLYDRSPPGSILGMQAGLGLAVLFLRQEESEIMWARRKIATIEALG
jgi:hypothetical protein